MATKKIGPFESKEQLANTEWANQKKRERRLKQKRIKDSDKCKKLTIFFNSK